VSRSRSTSDQSQGGERRTEATNRKIVSYLCDDEAEAAGSGYRTSSLLERGDRPLFDSIMREYPISTLLVWKTKEKVKHRARLSSATSLTDYVPDHPLEADGARRPAAPAETYIGLKGSEGRAVLDISSGSKSAPKTFVTGSEHDCSGMALGALRTSYSRTNAARRDLNS
jgi:hypothetical protein